MYKLYLAPFSFISDISDISEISEISEIPDNLHCQTGWRNEI